jgi:hypothetical protein
MVGQASSLSIKNDGQDARRHQILFLFAITFENPYRTQNIASGVQPCSKSWRTVKPHRSGSIST